MKKTNWTKKSNHDVEMALTEAIKMVRESHEDGFRLQYRMGLVSEARAEAERRGMDVIRIALTA